MIDDLILGGVFIPGLLALALIALIGTVVALRFLKATGATRAFTLRPLVELAVFTLLFGLLVQAARSAG